MNLFNNLPLYEAVIKDEFDGIEYIALTEKPATEVKWLAFSNELKFTADEEKKIITGPIMLAGVPIFRRTKELGEFYVIYNADTIKLMAEKMIKDNRCNFINVEHLTNSSLNGIHLIELYVKDSDRGVSPNEFSDVPDGSLFVTYKVENPDVWNLIKAGKFKGFSLEGLFTLETNNDEEDLEEIVTMIKKIRRIK